MLTLSGGQGEVLTITADGRFTEDAMSMRPLTGNEGGNRYSVTVAGTATGHVSTGGGKISYRYNDPASITLTISKNGTPGSTAHPVGRSEDYTCTNGASLTIYQQDGSTMAYRPAGR